jgi:toxin FitB
VNVIDSSGWLEYFSNGSNAAFFANAIEDFDSLIVPSITIYEVYKYAKRQAEDDPVRQAVEQMEKANVILLDSPLAKLAAELSLEYKLPMADSIILATAQTHNAIVWTQDSDFKDIPGVNYHPKN